MKRFLLALSLTALPIVGSLACSGDKDPGVAGVGTPGGGPGGTTAGPGGSTAGTGGPGGPGGASPAGAGGPGGGVVGGVAGGGGAMGAGAPTVTDYIQDATGESGLDKGTIDALRAGGKSCSAKVLYPYEGTVFPGGLVSPVIMWEGAADAAYARLRYDNPTNVDVQVAAPASNPGELRIPQKHWNEITRRSQGNTLIVTLTTRSGGTLSTCELKWRVARGNMTGALYYNTYNYPQAGGVGAVLRLTLGATQPELYLNTPGVPPAGPCISCHSVSAHGSVLAASRHDYTPFVGSLLGEAFQSFSVPITAAVQPTNLRPAADASFGALTPDGSLLLQMGNPQCTAGADSFPRAPNNFFLVQGPTVATLLDTSTGQPVQAKGLDPNMYMWMPQFSPDGKRVVFNHAKPDGKGGTDRRELAIMDFDQATRTFSNLRVIASRQGVEPSLPYAPTSSSGIPLIPGIPISGIPQGANGCTQALTGPDALGHLPAGSCSGPCYPAWPFFTPDGRGVIYALISEPDFAVAFPGRATPAKSELWYVNVDDPQNPVQFRMENANRARAGEDTLNNYYPTVLPVQVGGYFWVFWTSMRSWGHRRTDEAGIGGIIGDPSAVQAVKKRIWVSAVRASSTGAELAGGITADPSFPGFYLEGQSATGNTRAFAALNPCKATGNECQSGLDCCAGYCDIQSGADKGVCVNEVKCAKTNEKCSKDSDCCPPTGNEPQNTCIAGYCGFIVLN